MAATNATRTGVERSRDERTQPRTQKITTFLWFDNKAEEAVNFLCLRFQKLEDPELDTLW